METRYTFDENIVSDLYKEAFGIRPREEFWANWNSYSDEEKQVSWDQMLDFADRAAENELEAQIEAEADLEDRIQFMKSTIVGCTREDAIRYLHEVYDTRGSDEYLEHELGVRYGYISGSLKVGY